jgi:hypothetical protein
LLCALDTGCSYRSGWSAPPADRERQSVALHTAEARTHPGERDGDAAHRAAAERAVARERRREPVTGQHAEEQARRRARVAAIEHVAGPVQPPAPGDADDAAHPEWRDLRAQLAQDPGARAGIERSQCAADVAPSARQGGE